MKDCYMIVSLIAVIDVSAHAVATSFCVHNGIVRDFRWLSNSRLVSFSYTQIDMQKFTAKIVDMMKQEKLYASQGGPIILSQLWHLHRLGYDIELKSTITNWGKLTDWLNVADFNGVAVVQNYLDRMGREEWAKQVYEAEFVILCVGRFSGLPKLPDFPINQGPEVFNGVVIQNEYGKVNSAYGAAVKPYIKWPASMATSLDTKGSMGYEYAAELITGRELSLWGTKKSGLDIAVECASLIHTASNSPAGKSTYSLIREPGELVKIKYTDVPLLYYTKILSMPDGLAMEFKNPVAIPSLIFQEYMHESQTESETEIRISSLIPLLIRNGIRDGIRNGIFPSLIPLLISKGIRNGIFCIPSLNPSLIPFLISNGIRDRIHKFIIFVSDSVSD
ncbi:hypothetical protein Syun_016900 [Stephania yunnanensis]|uniref:WDR11 second beta-propeller domain-containing protein n=1 Tax=Stephania yunnanensis TaxID=152371 RepID=A0AAP0J870_9MAGN